MQSRFLQLQQPVAIITGVQRLQAPYKCLTHKQPAAVITDVQRLQAYYSALLKNNQQPSSLTYSAVYKRLTSALLKNMFSLRKLVCPCVLVNSVDVVPISQQYL